MRMVTYDLYDKIYSPSIAKKKQVREFSSQNVMEDKELNIRTSNQKISNIMSDDKITRKKNQFTKCAKNE